MNLKTSALALATLVSPAATSAKTAVKAPNAAKIENAVTNVVKENKRTASFAEAQRAQAAAGKAVVRDSLIMAKNVAPKKELANKRVGNLGYDMYGNVGTIYNAKNQAVNHMTRTPEGELMQMSKITYKPNGQKDTEVIYDANWGKDGKLGKFAEHKFNGNGTATATEFDQNGKAVYTRECKTEVFDGEEIAVE